MWNWKEDGTQRFVVNGSMSKRHVVLVDAKLNVTWQGMRPDLRLTTDIRMT